MAKKPASKYAAMLEAAVWATFVAVSSASALNMLHVINLTNQAQAIFGYVLEAYSLLVFGYIAYKAVENK